MSSVCPAERLPNLVRPSDSMWLATFRLGGAESTCKPPHHTGNRVGWDETRPALGGQGRTRLWVR